ncbi:tetratricopeptide repeat protein [Comamonas sp. w2-DMI]|uniref:tetratricopeptide repeat protein n=1 Tax=Comamonas sp. w2-DMI TaxID=3126391 RepID=UPI0032E454D3
MPHQYLRPEHRLIAVILAAAAATGCASKAPPQGYGVTQDNTAAEARQQMLQAEQATRVDTAQTYLDLITQMQQAGQWYASLAHTEAFEQQYGSTPQIRLLRADALRNTGQFSQAHQAYTALLTGGDTSTTARARRGLGLLHASQGQYGQAVAQLEMARKLNPIDANVLSDLAYAHMLDGRLAAAQLPILQAAQLAPANARVQLNLALYWLASGNQPEATRLLQRLSQPQGKNAPALIDQHSLQTLQTQLASVREAVQARADSGPAQAGPSVPVQVPMLQQTQVQQAGPELQATRQLAPPSGDATTAPASALASESRTRDNPL